MTIKNSGRDLDLPHEGSIKSSPQRKSGSENHDALINEIGLRTIPMIMKIEFETTIDTNIA